MTEQNPPKSAIVSSDHLASSPHGWQLSELEYALTMAQNAFARWMVHCMSAAGFQDFNPTDILIVHNINHRGKEKRLTDIAFVLNIEDTHIVNYSVKKLLKAGLVEGRKQGKEMFYSTTKAGQATCKRYAEIRKTCLLDAADQDMDEIRHAAKVLRATSGLYDQASRAAASF